MNELYRGSKFNDIYFSLVETLLTCPDFQITTRKGEVITELLNPTFEVEDPISCLVNTKRLNLDYLKKELAFYWSGSLLLKDIVSASKYWNKVSDDGVTINSNYGYFLLHVKNSSGFTQFEYAKKCLLDNLETKKSVMVIYERDHSKRSNDNPCTMYLQFFIRNKELILLTKMRSSDIWYGLPYDVPFFCLLQLKMYKELRESSVAYCDLDLGSYVHNSGSLHMYDRNREQVLKLVDDDDIRTTEPGCLVTDLLGVNDEIDSILQYIKD